MRRLWQIAVAAKEWGVLPSVAARDLDEDPEQLALVCIPLLRYSEAYSVWKTNDSAAIKARRGDPMMELVKEHDLELAEAELQGGE